MTTKKLDTLNVWQEARETAAMVFSTASEMRNELEVVEENRGKLTDLGLAINMANDKIIEHEQNGLKIINNSIKNGSLVKDLNKASAKAKKEAEKLKKETAEVEDVVKVVKAVAAIIVNVGILVA